MAISAKTLDFLAKNRLRNSRSWYLEHKGDYQEYVLAPLMELVQRLGPVAKQIDPILITEPKVDRTISRIYRDTRFSRDKSLYRDVMWCTFNRDKKAFHCPPCLFFEFSPDGFRYGCGYYRATTQTMDAIRQLILEKDPLFQKAYTAMNSQSVFQLEGESYKRSRFPSQPEHLKQWLDCKNIGYIHNSKDFGLLFSDSLWEALAEGFLLLAPFYQFLCRAEARTHKKE